MIEHDALMRANSLDEEIDRRMFLKKSLGGLAALVLAGGGSAYYTHNIEPQWLDIVRLTLSLPGLPEAFAGATIAHISDLHIGPYVSSGYIRRTLRWVAGQRPDYIFITGDFITRNSRFSSETEAALASLTASGGVYGVLGNHDHWHGADHVQRVVEAAGIRVLRNESTVLQRGDDQIWLLGVDDAYVGADDMARTIARVPLGAMKILLAHEPDFADVAMDHDVTLQLSGHSHGGQVCLPLIGAPLLPYLGRKYPAGLYHVKNGLLYTNRGLGVIFPAVRFNCRPEITFITLAGAAKGEAS